MSISNTEIASILLDIASRLKLKKENAFKIRAYENAADYIRDWPSSVEEIAIAGRLREVPGVGEAIDKKITELVKTGKLEFYEKLKMETDPLLKNRQ